MSFGRLGQVVLFVAVLYWGKPVLVPLALAFYLAFVLTPPSNRLEQLGLSRGLSVLTTLGGLLAGVVVVGAMLVAQVAELASKMHGYSAQMSNKLAGLQGNGLRIFSECSRALSELARGLERQLGTSDQLTAVRVVPGGASPMERLEGAFGPVLEPLAVMLLVLVLTVFVLAHREDLRARLILLLGTQNVTITTRTMTEAFARVSHLLLTQVYINSAFGGVIALGLYAIGIPYALLWGAVAGILRFVPVLGPWIATLLPALLAFVTFPGWQHALLTVGLFLGIDMTLANFIEPLVLGKRTGVSALALLISAVFWTWLWGALGLLLAMPITVCAAVVGRHVPELKFLAVALGDEPGLNPDLNFYQRTLARATKDAQRLVRRMLAESSLTRVLDELLVPALRFMAADQAAHVIGQDAVRRVLADVDGILGRIAPRKPRSEPHARSVVAIAADGAADDLLVRMLGASFDEGNIAVDVAKGADRLARLESAISLAPTVVFIAALPPSGNNNARFLCRRLRAELSQATVVVWLPEPAQQRSREAIARLRESGASYVVASLAEAQRLLSQDFQRASAA